MSYVQPDPTATPRAPPGQKERVGEAGPASWDSWALSRGWEACKVQEAEGIQGPCYGVTAGAGGPEPLRTGAGIGWANRRTDIGSLRAVPLCVPSMECHQHLPDIW